MASLAHAGASSAIAGSTTITLGFKEGRKDAPPAGIFMILGFFLSERVLCTA
jgi:hypothetical protein